MKMSSNKSTLCLHLVKFALFGFFIQETAATLTIKETKVEPFSLLLENQRQIIEKMDFIMKNMKSVENLEVRLSSLSYTLTSANAWIEDTFHKVNALKDEVKNVSQNMALISSTVIQNPRPREEGMNEELNPCHDLAIMFKNGARDVAKCQAIIASTKILGDTEKTTNGELSRNRKTEEWRNKKETEDNETKYYDEPESLVDIENSTLVLEIEQLINAEATRTEQWFVRLLSLLRNIEYRQHVSAITQDTRLNTLLHKIAVHQNILEGRLTQSMKIGFQNAHRDLEDKLGILESHVAREERIFTGLASVVTNLSIILEDVSYRRGNMSCSCLGNYNCSEVGDQFDGATVQISPSSLSFSGGELFINPSTNTSEPKETPKDRFYDNRGLFRYQPKDNESYISVSDLISPLDQLLINDTDFTRRKPTNQLNVTLNEVKHTLNRKLEEREVNKTLICETMKSLEGLATDINKRIANIENTISKQMVESEDKLIGLRIHQASSFYSHSKEVRHEMEKLERGLTETVRSSSNKIAKRLEGVRKALFTFIDAAVTSVSSAAVTSSQSTGMLVAKELREALKEIGSKIAESNAIRKNLQECPNIYKKIEGHCLLVLDRAGTSWRDGCRLCKSLGGDLAYFSNESAIPRLFDAGVTKNLWVRNIGNPIEEMECEFKSEKEQSEELTNSLADHITPQEDILIQKNETSLFCNVLSVKNMELKTASCAENLGVICQYKVNNEFA